ncbi:NADP-dependent oxidoreductase domain-containing protein [Cladochytrium replicatum]|nr:NADP-dependent oxidoreductase domain-containing protein [Cladochytrium replicatum]
MSTEAPTDLPKMEYVRFGNTGLKVSRICLGCMSFGSSKWQSWVLDEPESFQIIKLAWEAGINFWDTANVYSNGESEKIIGRAIKKLNIPREQLVLATKLFSYVAPDVSTPIGGITEQSPATVNQSGLSRKHIFEAVEKSLERLQTSYIDLYQIHRFDPNTPIEETMEALNDLVRLGKVRYIGASSMYAWQFAKMNNVAEKNGWTKFVSMQNLYNLCYREEEREMAPYCLDQGITMIPWSPLHRGILSGRKAGETVRSTTDMAAQRWFKKTEAEDLIIVNKVVEIAARMSAEQNKTITASQVALAWLYSKKVVSAAIVGIGKIHHLYDTIRSVSVKLSEADIRVLESLYTPKRIVGHL